MSITAMATPISGSFRFGGMFEVDDGSSYNQQPDFTKAASFWYYETQWYSQTGDYAGIHYGPSDYGIRLQLSDVQIPDFWGSWLVDSRNNLRNVSFDLTSVEFTITSTSFLAQGTAIAYMTGFDPTIATWQTTSTSYNALIHFWSEGTIITAIGVPASIADGGIAVGMLGGALVGLVWLRRKISVA